MTLRKRTIKFFYLIYLDIKPMYPKEMFYILFIAIGIAIFCFMPIFLLALFLTQLTSQPLNQETIVASISCWLFFVLFIVFIKYLISKWKAAK